METLHIWAGCRPPAPVLLLSTSKSLLFRALHLTAAELVDKQRWSLLLRSLKKDNPVKSQWNSMRLYLQSQIEQVAIRKHGSIQEMEQQRRSGALMHANKRRRDAVADRKKEDAEKDRVKVCGDCQPACQASSHACPTSAISAVKKCISCELQVNTTTVLCVR